MRKTIVYYLHFSWITWIVLFIAILNRHNQYRELIMFSVLALVMIHFLLSIALLMSFLDSREEKRWFKTHEELMEEKQKASESWTKAEELVYLLGEQESIRLWNEKEELNK